MSQRSNTVKRARQRAGMTQSQLAEACKTSQQQIQRIEADAQTVRLDLALKIAEALGTPVAKLFPETNAVIKKLQKTKGYDIGKPFSDDPEVVKEMDNAGVDVDFAVWTLKFRLRGGDWMYQKISSGDNNRLSHVLQRDRDEIDRTDFFLFNAEDREILVNLEHLVFAHQLFDAPSPPSKAEAEDANTEGEDEDESSLVVRVHLAGVPEPLAFEVEPDFPSGDEDDYENRPFRVLVCQLDGGALEAEFFSFVDSDGERAWFRTADVAMIEIPYSVFDVRLLGEEEQELQPAP